MGTRCASLPASPVSVGAEVVCISGSPPCAASQPGSPPAPGHCYRGYFRGGVQPGGWAVPWGSRPASLLAALSLYLLVFPLGPCADALWWGDGPGLRCEFPSREVLRAGGGLPTPNGLP